MHPDGQARHILAVNHAPEILELVQELLEEYGYRVSVRARDQVTLDDIVDLAPDLVILDYMWSSSDSDWSLLNLLRMDRRTRHVPVVLCTAAVRHVRDLSDHLSAMGVQVVLKPFDIDHLISIVGDALKAADNAIPEQ
jgi:CheY-like chemotaxis protein